MVYLLDLGSKRITPTHELHYYEDVWETYFIEVKSGKRKSVDFEKIKILNKKTQKLNKRVWVV